MTRFSLPTLASASLLALAMIAAPASVDLQHSAIGAKSAWAKNGGGDHGGGRGRGHGNGHGPQSGEIAGAELQGSLNAAHASATARAHAAPNSQIGKIASYESAIQAGDIAAAASSLADAANKAIIEPVVHAVNDLLGIDTAPVAGGGTVHETEAEVAAAAAAE